MSSVTFAGASRFRTKYLVAGWTLGKDDTPGASIDCRGRSMRMRFLDAARDFIPKKKLAQVLRKSKGIRW